MSQPQVATVILNWNGKHWLEKFLPSVVNTHYSNHKVVVIDNASTDDSITFLQTEFSEVEIVQLDQNYGFAGGYNHGLKKVDADYYAILNSDVETDSNWLNPVIKRMEANPKIGACQPKILAFNKKTNFEYAGACGGYIDKHGFPFCRGRIFTTDEKDDGQYNEARRIFWATGAALIVRSKLFHEARGFDAKFFAHMEEIDLCWRIQNMDYELWVEPNSVVYHVGGGTLGKENPRKTYLNFRNNLLMLSKNLPANDVVFRVFIRLLIDGQAAIKEFVSGNFKFLKAIFKAHMHFYGMLPHVLAERKKIKNKKRFKSLPGVYKRSIVWWYYGKNKKTFNSLPDSINP